MPDRAQRKSSDEQYKLILECRSSGMSDQQWCLANDINPGTFYNWVKRLRRTGAYEIPQPADKNTFTPAPKQEVVKLDILPDMPEHVYPVSSEHTFTDPVVTAPTIRITLGNLKIDLTNEADPRLLSQILRSVGGV